MTIQVKFGEIAQQFRGRWCCCLTAASLVQTLPVLWVFEDRPQAQRGKIHLDTWGVLVIVWIQPLSSNSGKWWCIGMDLLLRKYNPFLLVTVTPGGVVYPSYSSKELHVSSPLLLIPYWISSMCSRSHCHLLFWGVTSFGQERARIMSTPKRKATPLDTLPPICGGAIVTSIAAVTARITCILMSTFC